MLISDFLAQAAIYYRSSPKDQEIPYDGCFAMGLYYRPKITQMQAIAAIDDWGDEKFEDLLLAIAQTVRENSSDKVETKH